MRITFDRGVWQQTFKTHGAVQCLDKSVTEEVERGGLGAFAAF